MEFSSTTLLVLAILFLSTFIRSALGFGDALIAMPLLAIVVGLQVAT
ncbi:MAG: sulfite exporter TauE/SafE family protein, partial [Chloroflexota bacterium]